MLACIRYIHTHTHTRAGLNRGAGESADAEAEGGEGEQGDDVTDGPQARYNLADFTAGKVCPCVSVCLPACLSVCLPACLLRSRSLPPSLARARSLSL